MHVAQSAGMSTSPNTLERTAARLREAEDDLERDVEAQQQRWGYRLSRGRVEFDEAASRAHRRHKRSLRAFVAESSLLNLLTAPVIYSLIVPLLLLDAWVTMYQWVCFPIYGIAAVPRRSYVVMDRHRLGYLNAIEKINCEYCSYANGLIAYIREVAARTEQYWCPIKHSRAIPSPHSRYHLFVDYGDGTGYRDHLPSLRRALRPPSGESGGTAAGAGESRPGPSDAA
jgi:hypothetical protein